MQVKSYFGKLVWLMAHCGTKRAFLPFALSSVTELSIPKTMMSHLSMVKRGIGGQYFHQNYRIANVTDLLTN